MNFRDTLVIPLVTTAVLVIFWLVLRSGLPRLPRLLFRGRLRIRRIGVRGIRGLEWSSKGFVSRRKSTTNGGDGTSLDGGSPPDLLQSQHHPDAFVVRIAHIYFQFHRRDGKHRSWATLHVQGVGIRLPRAPVGGKKGRSTAAPREEPGKPLHSSAAEARQRELAEREEERLQRLMRSPPTSPSLNHRAALHQRRSSLVGAVTGGRAFSRSLAAGTSVSPQAEHATPNEGGSNGQRPRLPKRPFSSLIPNTSAASFRTIPLYVGWLVYAWLRDSMIPAMQGSLLKVARIGLFLLASAIPLLSSLLEVEVHRVEIYVQEAEAVLRVGRLGARYSMTVVSARHAHQRPRPASATPGATQPLGSGQNLAPKSTSAAREVPVQAEDWAAKKRSMENSQNTANSFQTAITSRPSRIPGVQVSITETLAAMPNRIGSGAKGAAAFIMAGIPAANGSLKVSFESIQIFDARVASHDSREGQRQTSRSATKRDSFFNLPSPGLLKSLQSQSGERSPTQKAFRLTKEELRRRGRKQPTDSFAHLEGSEDERNKSTSDLYVAHGRPNGHQRSGSSDAAMFGSSAMALSPLPTSDSGDGSIYSPFLTTSARWFETHQSRHQPHRPLAELLASPPLPGRFVASTSMHSMDSDMSDFSSDRGTDLRTFSTATPGIFHTLSAARQGLNTETSLLGEEDPKRVGFADPIGTPTSSAQNPGSGNGGRTLKRSSSTSRLNTMNTLSLSGFTDRWADWALEPVENSTFSSDSGWASSAQGQEEGPNQTRSARHAIPDSARLIALPGLSMVRVNFVLGPSMQIRQREAVHMGLELSDTNIGVEAVLRVIALIKSRKQEREEARLLSTSGQTAQKRPADVEEGHHEPASQTLEATRVQVSSTTNKKGRVMMAQLGSLSVFLPQLRLSHTLRPPGDKDPLQSRKPYQNASNDARAGGAALNVHLEAILRDFRFEVRSSDPTDPHHQKWLGTCGINKYKGHRREGARSPNLDESDAPQRSEEKEKAANFTPPVDTGAFESPSSPPSVAGRLLSEDELSGDGKSHSHKNTIFSARLGRNLRGGRHRKLVKLVEHRRAFHLEANFATLQLHCSTNADFKFDGASSANAQTGGVEERMSDLLILRDLNMKIKSSWTPFGLLPSLRAISAAASQRQLDPATAGSDVQDACLTFDLTHDSSVSNLASTTILPRPQCPFSFFASDPNEQALIAELEISQLSSHMKLRHLAALLSTTSALRTAKPPNIPRDERNAPLRLPRLAIACCTREVSLRVDASEESGGIDGAATVKAEAHRSLVVAAPSIDFVFHGSYKDAYAKRTAESRRAAWKSLSRGEASFLPDDPEWSRRSTSSHSKTLSISKRRSTVSASDRRYKPTVPTSSALPDAQEVNMAEHSARAGPARPGQQLAERFDGAGRPPASIMEKLSVPTASGPSEPSRNTSAQDNRQRQKAAYSGSIDYTFQYEIDSSFSVESVEAYFGFRKDPISKSRLALTVPSGSDLPPFGMSHQHLLSMHGLQAQIAGVVPAGTIRELGGVGLPTLMIPRAATDCQTRVGDLAVDLWHPQALRLTRDMLETLTSAVDTAVRAEDSEPSAVPVLSPDQSGTGTGHQNLLDKLPGGVYFFSHIKNTTVNLGGPDSRCVTDVFRGICTNIDEITFEYVASKDDRFRGYQFGVRSGISLPEDIRVNANASAVEGPAAIARFLVIGFKIVPLLDAERVGSVPKLLAEELKSGNGVGTRRVDSLSGHSHDHAAPDGKLTTQFAPAVWDFQKTKLRLLGRRSAAEPPQQEDVNNYIIKTTSFNLNASLRQKADRSEPMRLKLDANNDGKLLMQMEMLHTYCILLAVSTIASLRPSSSRQSPPHQKQKAATSPGAGKYGTKRGSDQSIILTYDIPKVDIFVTLPTNIRLFLHFHRLNISYQTRRGVEVLWETLVAAVESARVPVTDLWEEALRLRKWRVLVNPPNMQDEPAAVSINGTAASVRIPTDYQFHNVIEYSTVAFKATKQLVHQFLRNSSETIIRPVAEEPKRVPHISLRLQTLSVEAEDDPIETRLNLVWRAGFREQQRRLEREDAFVEAAQEIKDAERGKSSISLTPSVAANLNTTDPGPGGAPRQEDPASQVIDEAKERLQTFNSVEWVRRHRSAKREQERREEQTRTEIFGSQSLDSFALPVRIAKPSLSAPLVRSVMTHVSIDIARPTFAYEDLSEFLFFHGDGIPKDTKYSTNIPLHLCLRFGEWRISLRDYPLPILHVPPVGTEERDAYTWTMEGDICLAEQLGGPESIREVPAVIVPASTGRQGAAEYSMAVPKMVMPLKFYGSPVTEVKTPFPTRIVWGQSLQPAIHDVQRVIESITSPPHDPSPRLPFWDKIPLLLHGRFHLKFSGSGDLHFFLKGSRDPYHVTGHGAGWVMCWRDSVELRVGFDNPEREFFQVVSNEYLLAIPDLQDYLDLAASGQAALRNGGESDSSEQESVTGSRQRYMIEPRFKKVCLRLSNGVRWGVGLIYERTCTDDSCRRRPRCRGQPFYRECRIWDRTPHWQVATKSKQEAEKMPLSLRSDSFEGWRSHHIHPSLSIFSPKEGIGSNAKANGAMNGLYLSPLAWEHFWRWIALFSGALTLPIRQGRLFPNTPPQSAKLSTFVATIKYRFLIEPLFISHFYQQTSKADLARGMTALVGVKARIDTFRADLHQRQEETLKDRPELKKKLKVFHKPFNEAEVDLSGIDLRTVRARFTDSDSQLLEDLDFDAEDEVDDFPDTSTSEVDDTWFDLADFAETDWQPPSAPEPEISIIQTLVCPRFHYYRKVESKRERRARQASLDQPVDGDEGSSGPGTEHPIDTELTPISQLAYSKFGNERTHDCLVGTSPSAPIVQTQLAESRLSFLLAELQTLASAQEASAPRASEDNISTTTSTTFTETSELPGRNQPPEVFATRIADLKVKIRLIEDFLRALNRLQQDTNGASNNQMFVQAVSEDRIDLRALYRDWETFHNRYFVHNPIVYFSTETRNSLLKYYLASRMRKGFAHHMTAKAVRYVRNLRSEEPFKSAGPERPDIPSPDEVHGFDIKNFLAQKMQFVMAETPRLDQDPHFGSTAAAAQQPEPRRGLTESFTINKSNVAVLLKPQIVLQASGPVQSSVIITAKRVRLQNYSVLEDRFSEDELNARLMYRNFLAVDSLQSFAPTTHCQYLRSAPHRTKFAYVPLETLIDTGYQTRDFDRIISSTDATAAYDKFNRLRVNDSDKIIVPEGQISNPEFDHLLHHMDFVQVRCPRIALSADPDHFAAIYAVVTDLLLYRDPMRQDQSKRLEEMLFNYDFENLDLLCDDLTTLQSQVRHAKDRLSQYQEHFHLLNKEGKQTLFLLHVEQMELVEKLDILMRAITTSRDHRAAMDTEKKSALRLQATADELSWYMMGAQDGEQLAKLAIKNANFSWLNKADSSTSNSLSIGDLQALNIRPDAHFAEIISKYAQSGEHRMAKKNLFLLASWRVLAPVGGIAIIEDFELNLHPVRLSIELKVGREIMDYIFGSKRRQIKHEQEARITELREEHAVQFAASERTTSKKGKRKGIFAFLGANKEKNTIAGQERLALPAPDDDRQVGRSSMHRGSPTKRKSRSKSREPPAGRRRRSMEDGHSRSRARDRSRARSEKDVDREAAGSDSEDCSDNGDKQQRIIARRNAESMRRRASTNRTFVNVKFAETVLCLSYKGDKQKSITDLFDLVFRAPTLEYRNQTCGYEDLVNFCKKDIFRAAWDQRSSLLKGILHRPRKTSRNVRDFAAQGIGSAVNRITGQERSVSSSKSDIGVSSRPKEGSSSNLSLSHPATLMDDDEDEDEDEDEEEEEEDEDEEDDGSGKCDLSDARETGNTSSISIQVTESTHDSWSDDTSSVGTQIWHSPQQH